MKLLQIILLAFITTGANAQAWVWEKGVVESIYKNGVTTDGNDNIITLSLITQSPSVTEISLKKYTKDGLLLWSKLLTKAGTISSSLQPIGSVVTDKSGNIYIYSHGFDSIDHQFTGIKRIGVTKLTANGSVLWHKGYYPNPSISLTYFPNLQIDEQENVYIGFNQSYASFGSTTIILGDSSTSIFLSGNQYFSIGSLSPSGGTRWVRVFKYTYYVGATSPTWDGWTGGFSILGQKLFLTGNLFNSQLILDNNLILSAYNKSSWLAAFNTSTGQSVWGRSQNVIYDCTGQPNATNCSVSIPSVICNKSSVKVGLTNNLNGAFVFKPLDTIATYPLGGTPAYKSYYTLYDTLNNPIQGNTLHVLSNSIISDTYASEFLVGSRNNFYFLVLKDTLSKVDTNFNTIWKIVIPSLTSVHFPNGNNDIIVGYSNGFNNFRMGKLIDSAAVISGKTYADWDNSGTYTNADSALANILISNGVPSSIVLSSRDSGRYLMYVLPGSYSITPNYNHPYYQFLPATHSATITQYSDTIKGKDFRLRPLFPFTDVSISFTALNNARPGRQAQYRVAVKNLGPSTEAVQVGLKLPALTSYNSITGATAVVNAPDSITIDMGNVNPFATKTATLNLMVATTTQLNSQLIYYPKAYPYVTDTIKTNNVDTLIQTVRTSFDPNDKEVNYAGRPLADSTKHLTYTIHFQNTGTDTAFYVRIMDTLSSKLNASTFEMLDASHTVTTEIKNNIVSFIFNPIELPDSNHNEPQSHGFVKFKIKPKLPIIITDTIYNKSAIYFDYNTPVVTNNAKSWFYTNAPVPVILQSFVAEKKTTFNLLKFVTASEPNLDKFIVERSTDGVNFYSIGTVLPKGSNSTGGSYSFTDLNPAAVNFYRLKMQDRDSKITYSWVVVVKKEKGSSPVSIFPNPATDNFYISFKNISGNTIYSCRITTATGKLVWSQTVNPAIRNTYSVNSDNLPFGIYFVSISDGSSNNYSQKLIINH